MMAIDPYNRIMRAAEKGRGVRFTPAEVARLSLDDAIAMRAYHLATPVESERQQGGSHAE